ncbi:hypothetical protein SAMN05444156_2455 [Verrucomicrobium sp. GAS474]|uniref:rolling circle replication-associated protein n=1 Tax=Verrucomicrobium sp. GAS474 TaxID=1882831 RepID=UPI00087DE725|nr:hypothetical protein [Verrucomicrobium sp. GAS474]SDU18212.1 hypothetical protein SAMN05444156_2455 [Verrucomicrobium sp. GAS474]
MNKSLVAFQLTCDKLFARYEVLYFWTFTFKEAMPDWYYSRTWNRFWVDFTGHFPDLIRGVKVAEHHKTHGLHYHAILNQRLPVGLVRRIGSKYGIGRVHVMKCDKGAVGYLEKYLGKQHWKDFHAGCRRWSPVGTWDHTKVSDIVVESDFTRQLAFETRGKKIDYRTYRGYRQNYMAFGDIQGPSRAYLAEVRKSYTPVRSFSDFDKNERSAAKLAMVADSENPF